MSHSLVPCPGCSRHVRADDAACPFCAAPVTHRVERSVTGSQATRVVVALAAALTASASLSACYGGPPHPRALDVYPQRVNAAPDSGAALEQTPKP
ncbi:MAG: hypothetical protein IPN17_28125 [Deltaproteobacteria bacterium]|nr:hypothetical protein [Deltaproteobacteria bacterium]MBK8696023.1 hypothetical protein [Deltaproteobacteria bacterium]MBP6834140.1 hypothetical protein [Deltaproteobacteria bacterium]